LPCISPSPIPSTLSRLDLLVLASSQPAMAAAPPGGDNGDIPAAAGIHVYQRSFTRQVRSIVIALLLWLCVGRRRARVCVCTCVMHRGACS
jgi:hypothetical protein